MIYLKNTYYNVGNIHFWEKKEIELEFKNPKKSDVKLEIIIISEWLELLSEREILFTSEESKKIKFLVNGLSVSSGNHWCEVLLCEPLRKEVLVREIILGTFLPEKVAEESDENMLSLIKISPDLIDIGNIIKGNRTIRNFNIENNDNLSVKVLMTCFDKWIKLTGGKDREGNEFYFKDNKAELELQPGEIFTVDLEIDSRFCMADLKHMGEVYISCPDRDIADSSVKIKIRSFNIKHFFIDFHEVNVGKVLPGEDLTWELQIKYPGERHDIILAGEMISLSDWIKIEENEFLIKHGETSTVKIHSIIPEDMSKGRKESFVLVNFHPEKCSPSLPSIPQQTGKIILDIC
jgi:hypothetical protein